MRATRLAVVAVLVGLAGCSYSYRNPAEELGPGEVGGRTVAGVEVLIDGVAISVQGAALDATSRQNGRFTMLPLPIGRHSLMFRKGKERALQREVEIAWGKDGQPQGLWLGDVTIPAAVGIYGTAATADGTPLADNGVAVDEVSGAVVPVDGGSYGDFTFEGLSIGAHRIRLYVSDELGHPWVGGPAEVNILAEEAGTQKTLTRFTLHRVGTAPQDTGLIKLRFNVAGSIPGLRLSDVKLTGLPGTVGFASDGTAQVDLPEGLFTVGIELPPGLNGVTPPPRKTFVAVKGKTLDLGTLYAVTDQAQDQAALSCQSDADCAPAPGVCSSGICAGYTPPPQAPASVPWCDMSTRGCVLGTPWGGISTGQPPTSYGPPYTATCAGYADGTGTVAVACGASCTPDGLAVVSGNAGAPGCPVPATPLVVSPLHAFTAGSCRTGDVITFTASGGTPPYTWTRTAGYLSVSPGTTQATWDACDYAVGDYSISVADSGALVQRASAIGTVKRPPYVASRGPLSGAVDVPTSTSVTATFSEPLAPASVNAATMEVSVAGVAVVGAVALDAPGTTLTFTPAALLPAGALVSILVDPAVTDVYGVAMTYQDSWYFTTAVPFVPSPAKALAAFTLAGVAGSIDEVAKTVAVTLPAGIAVTALVASFTTTGIGVAVGATPQVSGVTANDFTAPVTYVVTAQDGSTASYLVTVTVTGPLGAVWAPISTTGAPSSSGASVVWTGNQMIVWGGTVASAPVNTGSRYDPATDAWTAMSTTGAPSARMSPSAVWTGTQLIVWGGYLGGVLMTNTGGRYDPASDTWTATSTTGAPSARYGTLSAWTGTEMIVWGGATTGTSTNNEGARYDPLTDTWKAMSTAGAPAGRFNGPAIWTGTEMIVWGGDSGNGYLNGGGRYDPVTDTWIATATTGAPALLAQFSMVWTGSEMIVWGGENQAYLPQATGSRYDPVTDRWTSVSTPGAPAARRTHTAVWTGKAMIVWGGWDGTRVVDTGGQYDPVTDAWTATTLTASPSARHDHAAAWSGTQMVVWGGSDGVGTTLGTGGRYTP